MGTLRLGQKFVEGLGGCLPSQRFSRPAVEGGRHGVEFVVAVGREVSAFREVLSQQPIGVLVGPGAMAGNG